MWEYKQSTLDTTLGGSIRRGRRQVQEEWGKYKQEDREGDETPARGIESKVG